MTPKDFYDTSRRALAAVYAATEKVGMPVGALFSAGERLLDTSLASFGRAGGAIVLLTALIELEDRMRVQAESDAYWDDMELDEEEWN